MVYISHEMLDNNVKEELVEAFQKFGGNVDQNGITRKQLRETMEAMGEKRLSDAEYELLFEETDYDGDGTISFEDFVRMMMSQWSIIV